MNQEIKKLPISEIRDYRTCFYVASSMDPGQAQAFVSRDDQRSRPYGLEQDLLPPKGLRVRLYPSLSEHAGTIFVDLGFDPRSYLHFDGSHGSKEDKSLPDITKEGIERFMRLSKKVRAKTAVFMGLDEEYYCSENLL